MTATKNPNARTHDFHGFYQTAPVRYEQRHIELRFWLTTLYNATGGGLIVGMNPDRPGVAP